MGSQIFNPDAYLQEVLEHYAMHNQELKPLMDKVLHFFDMTKNAIESEYGPKLASAPFVSGSIKKKTAISAKFDLDLVVPFKNDAFGGGRQEVKLDTMMKRVSSFLASELLQQPYTQKWRPQKRSVALTFSEGGFEVLIEVVPAMEYTEGDFRKTGNLLLFDLDSKKHFQTNIQKHIEALSGRDKEIQIIKLLKVWKMTKQVPIKSFVLEMIVLKAFRQRMITDTDKLAVRLFKTIAYINNNIAKPDFKLIDPGNSSNNVMDTLTMSERNQIKNRCQNFLSRFEADNQVLKKYIPFKKRKAMMKIKRSEFNTFYINGNIHLLEINPSFANQEDSGFEARFDLKLLSCVKWEEFGELHISSNGIYLVIEYEKEGDGNQNGIFGSPERQLKEDFKVITQGIEKARSQNYNNIPRVYCDGGCTWTTDQIVKLLSAISKNEKPE